MEKKKLNDKGALKDQDQAARMAGKTPSLLFVKMTVQRITSVRRAPKIGTCLRLPLTEARAYINRDQAVEISKEDYGKYLAAVAAKGEDSAMGTKQDGWSE